jgi:SAM-dependent methyltransferase
MDDADKLKEVEKAIQSAADDGFKVRATSEYNRIKGWVRGEIDLSTAQILDFGCGDGVPAASFALRHPGATVFATDVEAVSPATLERTLQRQVGMNMPKNLYLSTIRAGKLPDQGDFDLINAWSVFEHVHEDWIEEILRELKKRLKRRGRLFLMSEPLYFSPRGSHLYRYFEAPWHHLLLSFDALRNAVISEQAGEREIREWQQFLELNRMTAQQLRELALGVGFSVAREQVFRTDLIPPVRLTQIYHLEVLLTTGVQIMFK